MKSVFGLCFLIFLLHCVSTFAKPNIIVLGGKRCVNMWDEGCINGQLPGAGNDDDYLNGGFNPGKRCLNVWDENCHNGAMTNDGNEVSYNGEDIPAGRRFIYELLEKLHRKHQLQ